MLIRVYSYEQGRISFFRGPWAHFEVGLHFYIYNTILQLFVIISTLLQFYHV